METRVQRWGNSLALRIPKHLANAAGLECNTAVEIVIRDNDLVIMRLQKPAFDLDQLLALVTDDNVHHEMESGPAQGVEVW